MIADTKKATTYHGKTSEPSKKRRAEIDDVSRGRIKKVRFADEMVSR